MNKPWASDVSGALAGVAAGAAALAVAQVGGKLVPGAMPPLQVLGDLVIRVTPVSVTEALIRQVGHSDKLVLLLSILVVAVVAAALVGVLFVRGRVRLACTGIAVLTVLPLVGTPGEANGSIAWQLLALVPAGALGAVVLWALGRPLLTVAPAAPLPVPAPGSGRQARRQRHAAEQAAQALATRGIQRRQLLRAGLVLTASAVLGSTAVKRLSQPSLALMSRLRAALPKPANPLPVLVDEFAALGASPLVTPIESFYRIDTALSPPQVDPDSWSLTLSRDGKPLRTYTYDELLSRATTQADITIGCVSNEVGGDLIGTARWQGVLLSELLREAGAARPQRIAGVSVDGWVASFRGEYAYDGRPAMVAVGMNGQPLPVLHGFPARLVVPGLYGYTSATKWLQQIDVSDQTDLPGFWAERGWAPEVDVHLTSRIDTPHDRATLKAGSTRLSGVAWAPVVGVAAVDVQVDDGAWQPAQLSKVVSGTLWRQWTLDWQPPVGRYTVRVRATDGSGKVQDSRRRPVFPSGATGLHEVGVDVV